MESRENHHHQPENASPESRPGQHEEGTPVALTSSALLKRLRVGRSERFSEMDESQLLAALDSAEWQVRVAAIQTLEEWGTRAPVERLINAVRDEHEAVRAAAARALGALGNPEAVVPLSEALHDPVWFVRATALEALGTLRQTAVVAQLKIALQDEDEAVRAAAVRALGTMEEHVPLEDLLPALQDRAWQVREMAVLTLGTRKELFPWAALASALQDEDESVRRAVHFVQETYPERFAETVQQEGQKKGALSLDDEQGIQQVISHHGSQRYPRQGLLRILRLVLLACWTIFLGYLVGVAWTLVQLTHGDLAQMTDRVLVQVLSAPFGWLDSFPALLRGLCLALVLLLFFGCLWAARDAWYEHRWVSRQRVPREEDEIEARGHDQSRRQPVDPSLQDRTPRRLSRRAALVGLTTALLAGNTIAWSLLLNRRRRPQAPALGSTLFTYLGHDVGVNAVAWSPDGKRIASASEDNTVQVWEAATGRHVLTYRGHTAGSEAPALGHPDHIGVTSVAWSPDGKRIASGGSDKTVRVWDAITGHTLFTYRGHRHGVNSVAWSPDGSHIASGSKDSTVQVWDASDGSHTFTYKGHTAFVYAVAWSPYGTRIASASADTTVQVWDASDGSHVYTYHGHTDWVIAVAWSPDGTRIASGSQDTTTQVWAAATGHLLLTYRGHTEVVLAVAWSPNGTRIASGGGIWKDLTVQVWNAANGDHLFTYRGHTSWVNAVAWSPDGTRIASASADTTVQVWEAN